MKVEFNLNYRSLLQQSMTLDFSSSSGKGSNDLVLNGGPRVEFERSEKIEVLGLYSEKIMLKGVQGEADLKELRSEKARADGTDLLTVDVPKISAQTAADNILGFVERRIQLEKAQGASDEELSDLLADARAGVEKGYSLARDDLDALGMMSESLKSEINESYDLVDQGLNKLEEDLFGADLSGGREVVSSPTAVPNDGAAVTPDDSKDNSAATVSGSFQETSAFGIQSKYRASSSFSLTTQDGDVVEINFSTKRAFAAMIERSFGQVGFDASMRQVERFNLSVDGDLDLDELRAIGDLLLQLSEVSEKFFDGDVLSAFESALAVGFDGSEIAEFSLDLRQTSVDRISGSYERLPSFGSGADLKYQPLVEQAGNVKLLSEQLSQFEYAFDQIRNLFDEVLSFDAAYAGNIDSGLLKNINKFVDYLL